MGVRTSKIFAAMAKQHIGYQSLGCLEKDIRNHFDKERRLELESGDANAMIEYFMHMKEEDPDFFYAMDFDKEQRLKNIFWVHGKGRSDYKIFGDVVSFDTTYITNKYKMPFAPFIGVSNHFQSTILGCALLVDETSSTVMHDAEGNDLLVQVAEKLHMKKPDHFIPHAGASKTIPKDGEVVPEVQAAAAVHQTTAGAQSEKNSRGCLKAK